MKDMGLHYGNSDEALIVGKDTVYVHTDIKKVEKDAEGNDVDNLYQYNEVQYDKDEYIKVISQKNEELETELTSTQVALCDVYELISES